MQLRKVYVDMNINQVTIGENENIDDKMEVIKTKMIYPHQEQLMKQISEGSDTSSIDKMRIQLFNLNPMVGADLFCFSLVNGQGDKDLQAYQNSQTSFGRFMTTMRNNDEQNKNIGINHNYFEYLTLCGTDEVNVKKWVIFVNKVMVEQQIEYKQTRSSRKSRSSSSSSAYSSLETMEDKKIIEEENNLKKQQKDLQEAAQRTDKEKTEQELNQLNAQLQELQETMTKQEEYESSQISNQMIRINKIEGQINDKEEQAKCIEEALQIRKEEENEQVIRMLKDEELTKVSKIVKTAQEKMRKQMESRIKKLTERLQAQEDNMNDEKAGIDNMMKNIIERGIREGDKSVCLYNAKSVWVDYEKKGCQQLSENWRSYVETTIQKGCSKILENQEESFEENQFGENDLLNKINMCTKFDYFCDICCKTQFGDEQYNSLMDCISGCNAQFEPLIKGKDEITIPITNIIDPNVSEQFKKKIEEQSQKVAGGSGNTNKFRFKQWDMKDRLESVLGVKKHLIKNIDSQKTRL